MGVEGRKDILSTPPPIPSMPPKVLEIRLMTMSPKTLSTVKRNARTRSGARAAGLGRDGTRPRSRAGSENVARMTTRQTIAPATAAACRKVVVMV
jgi:hypothetical protein